MARPRQDPKVGAVPLVSHLFLLSCGAILPAPGDVLAGGLDCCVYIAFNHGNRASLRLFLSLLVLWRVRPQGAIRVREIDILYRERNKTNPAIGISATVISSAKINSKIGKRCVASLIYVEPLCSALRKVSSDSTFDYWCPLFL